MKKKETLNRKAYWLWCRARLPKFLNKYGPKETPAWLVYAAYTGYTEHAPAWRRAANFMDEYNDVPRHWTTWHKAVRKWPVWVWQHLPKQVLGRKLASGLLLTAQP